MSERFSSDSSETSPLTRALTALLLLGGLVWGFLWWRGGPRNPPSVHRHEEGEHGGIIIAVGDEHYHIEALFATGGSFKLFTLGKDQSRVMSVPLQTITAYVKPAGAMEAVPVTLEPSRQPGDPDDQTSSFEGTLPLELVGSELLVVVPSIAMGDGRFRFGFLAQAGDEAVMPRKITNAAERDLYLTPGGKYTEEDIKANESMTPSEKFKGFQSNHNIHAARGDKICPITNTKANSGCTWVVNGQRHEFCCPPCIDEFVRLAKEHPEQILDPSEYVQK